jgi:choline transport protein
MGDSSNQRRSLERPDTTSKSSYQISQGIADKSTDLDASSDEQFAHHEGYNNTGIDAADMLRLGKKQEVKRNFNLWSSIGFVAIYMATWEFVLITMSVGFTNGGFAAMFWCYVTTTVSYAAVVASLAEMASMAPTSGGRLEKRWMRWMYADPNVFSSGQYHWVSEFAPPSYQKVRRLMQLLPFSSID